MLSGSRGWLAKLGAALAGTVIMLVILNYAFLAGGYFTGHQRMYMFDALLGWRVLPNRARRILLTLTFMVSAYCPMNRVTSGPST
jgi:hypothetical protein